MNTNSQLFNKFAAQLLTAPADIKAAFTTWWQAQNRQTKTVSPYHQSIGSWRKVFHLPELAGFIDADGNFIPRPTNCPNCGSDDIVAVGEMTSAGGDMVSVIEWRCEDCDHEWLLGPSVGKL